MGHGTAERSNSPTGQGQLEKLIENLQLNGGEQEVDTKNFTIHHLS